MDFNRYIEYSNLKNDCTSKDIIKLCKDAIKYHFESICIYPCYIELAKECLKDTNIHISTIVGGKHGMNTPKVKSYEAIDTIEMGADEIGIYLNIAALKEKEYDYIKKEIEEVRDCIDGKTLKVIVKICQLEASELIKVVELCNETFVNYIEILSKKKHFKKVMKDIEIIKEHKNEVLEIQVNTKIDTFDKLEKLIDKKVNRVTVSYPFKLDKLQGEKEKP